MVKMSKEKGEKREQEIEIKDCEWSLREKRVIT